MATLKDIAAEAGVSVMTVSNVINKNYTKVSRKNIEIIDKIIKRYNYVPNLTARSLVGKSSRIIGLIIPNEIGGSFLDNPYNSMIVNEIEMAVRKSEYYLMIRSVDGSAQIMELMQNWGVDGAIMFGVFDDVLDEIMQQCKSPMVFLDTYSDNRKVVNVGTNDFKGGYLSTKYLISNGHSKIAFLGPLNNHEGDDVINCRLNGYKAALEESGISVNDPYISELNSTYKDGVRVGEFISTMPDRPTAIVSCSDIAAIGLLEGIRLSGLSVPHDVSVIGFDDLECCCYCSPKLTTVHQDIAVKGATAVKLLFEQLKYDPVSDETLPSENIVLDVRIVERNSVSRAQ